MRLFRQPVQLFDKVLSFSRFSAGSLWQCCTSTSQRLSKLCNSQNYKLLFISWTFQTGDLSMDLFELLSSLDVHWWPRVVWCFLSDSRCYGTHPLQSMHCWDTDAMLYVIEIVYIFWELIFFISVSLVMWVDFNVRDNLWTDFFTGGSIIMDYELFTAEHQ